MEVLRIRPCQPSLESHYHFRRSLHCRLSVRVKETARPLPLPENSSWATLMYPRHPSMPQPPLAPSLLAADSALAVAHHCPTPSPPRMRHLWFPSSFFQTLCPNSKMFVSSCAVPDTRTPRGIEYHLVIDLLPYPKLLREAHSRKGCRRPRRRNAEATVSQPHSQRRYSDRVSHNERTSKEETPPDIRLRRIDNRKRGSSGRRNGRRWMFLGARPMRSALRCAGLLLPGKVYLRRPGCRITVTILVGTWPTHPVPLSTRSY